MSKIILLLYFLIFVPPITAQEGSQPTGSVLGDSPIPFSLLENWLEIPDRGALLGNILIIGGQIPLNVSNKDIHIVTNENVTQPSNSSLSLLNALEVLTTRYRFNVTWVVTSLTSFNSTEVISLISAARPLSMGAIVVVEQYYGSPYDSLGRYLAGISQLGVPVITTAIPSSTGGDLLAPGSNPKIITISPLLMSSPYFSETINPELFQQAYPTARYQRDDLKSTPDFLMPGMEVDFRLNSTSKVINSNQLPSLLFSIGFLSLKSVLKSPSSEIVEHIIRQSRRFDSFEISLNQQGYGIPFFSSIGEDFELAATDISIDPFRTANVTTITSNQVISVQIHLPSFEDIELQEVRMVQNSEIVWNSEFSLEAEIPPYDQFINGLIATSDQGVQITPSLISLDLEVGVLKDGPGEIRFLLRHGDKLVEISKEVIIDNSLRLVAYVSKFESDGIFNGDYATSKYMSTFLSLSRRGFAVSVLRSEYDFKREVENINHLVMIIADPDNMTANDTSDLNTYASGGGNILFFMDYSKQLEDSSPFSYMSYYGIPRSLDAWLRREGIFLSKYSFPDSALFVDDLSVTDTKYNLVPWQNTIEGLEDYPLFPFRGYLQRGDNTSLNQIEDFGSTEVYGSTNEFKRGLLTVIGTNSPLISNFINPYSFKFQESVDILQSILSIATGTNNVKFSPRIRVDQLTNQIEIRLDIEMAIAYTHSAWKVKVDLGGRSWTFEGLQERVLLYPNILTEKGMLEVSLVLGKVVVAKATVELEIGVSTAKKITLGTIWVAVLVGIVVNNYKRRR